MNNIEQNISAPTRTLILDWKGVMVEKISKRQVIKDAVFSPLGLGGSLKLAVKYALGKLSDAENETLNGLIAKQAEKFKYKEFKMGMSNPTAADIIKGGWAPLFDGEKFDLRLCSNMHLTKDFNKNFYKHVQTTFNSSKDSKAFKRFGSYNNKNVRNRFCLLKQGESKSEYYYNVMKSDVKHGRETWIVDDKMENIISAYNAAQNAGQKKTKLIFITSNYQQADFAKEILGAVCYKSICESR